MFAKRYFAQWYLGAPLIHVNRRATSFHSLFKRPNSTFPN